MIRSSALAVYLIFDKTGILYSCLKLERKRWVQDTELSKKDISKKIYLHITIMKFLENIAFTFEIRA